jgi:hypothetical protein
MFKPFTFMNQVPRLDPGTVRTPAECGLVPVSAGHVASSAVRRIGSKPDVIFLFAWNKQLFMQGARSMPADYCTRRWGGRLLHILALATPCLIAGCGDGGTEPASVTPVQQKKVQEYLGNYRQQMIEANKANAKSKVSDVPKKSP